MADQVVPPANRDIKDGTSALGFWSRDVAVHEVGRDMVCSAVALPM